MDGHRLSKRQATLHHHSCRRNNRIMLMTLPRRRTLRGNTTARQTAFRYVLSLKAETHLKYYSLPNFPFQRVQDPRYQLPSRIVRKPVRGAGTEKALKIRKTASTRKRPPRLNFLEGTMRSVKRNLRTYGSPLCHSAVLFKFQS